MSRIAELVYEDLIARGRKVATAKEWWSLVEKFVEVCGEKESYDRSDLIKYLAVLRTKYKHGNNTIYKDMRPLKLLCEIQGWDGGFPKVVLPKVNADEVRRTIFSTDEIRLLVLKSREMLPVRHLAYLALSTTYGMRRGELCGLDARELREGKTVTVSTLKGGLTTIHSVPEQIVPFIQHYENAELDYMTDVFEKAVKVLKLKLVGDRWGWHSVRRALTTELLLKEVSGLNILRFMRWSEASIRGEFGMLKLYAKQDQERVDREVFRIHPFLDYWA